MIDRIGDPRKTGANYSPGWLAQRLIYKFQVRGGLQTMCFRQRAGDTNELARWVRLDVPSDPAGMAAKWRVNHPSVRHWRNQ